MEPTHLTLMIDEALERFGGRELISGGEVVDFLLDLRLATLSEPLGPTFEAPEPVRSH
jgi:hypothetical protein